VVRGTARALAAALLRLIRSEPSPLVVARRFLSFGPGIVGGTGGSGTRMVARILRRSGMYLGTELNESEDAVELGAYSDRWINSFAQFRDRDPPAELEAEMLADLSGIFDRHLGGLEAPCPWGWKEPRSAYLLPFFVRHLPTLRFLHVVRDGRDMAFSGNQNQLRKHGTAIGLPRSELSQPAQSMALWSWLNVETARFGAERLGDRYLRVRFEDACREPVVIARQILDFFALPGDPRWAAAEVSAPGTLGRWRSQEPTVLAELERVGGSALAELGYELTLPTLRSDGRN
jgi:hypothetical protein